MSKQTKGNFSKFMAGKGFYVALTFCLIGAGASAALGQFGVTLAYANAPAKEISVFDYTQVIFSAILGFFLFGQLPDGWSVLGYLLICGISVAVFFYNRNLERKGQ